MSEIKFVLDPVLGHQVREWARSELEADPHGEGPFGDEYRTTSLYFDTAEHDVFHRRGSFGRAKYRVRRYSEHDFVFLERKLRKPGFLFKRRTRTPIGFSISSSGLRPMAPGSATGSIAASWRGAFDRCAACRTTVWRVAGRSMGRLCV